MITTICNKKVIYNKSDEHIVKSRKWHINDSGYVVWRGIENGKKVTIRLHRVINKTPAGLVTDHVNHNRLDNRRCNLRTCTQSENMHNLSNPGKGYWFHRKNKNWVVEYCGKHIGCFSTEEEAINIVKIIRAGGTYKKPERMYCKYGHDLSDAYNYRNRKMCKLCQSRRGKEYYERKTKHKVDGNNDK